METSNTTFDKLENKALKAKSLNELFTFWKCAHCEEVNFEETTFMGDGTNPPIPRESFIADGIIDKYKYNKVGRRVLFILKEANIGKPEYREFNPMQGDQRIWYLKYIHGIMSDNKSKQCEKMGIMAYYLQNNTQCQESPNKMVPTDEDIRDALESSSFMNINKRGGGASSNPLKLEKYYNRYKNFIKKQIELLNPSSIIIIGDMDYINCTQNIPRYSMWHTAHHMNGENREEHPIFSNDRNVDCYIRHFLEKIKKEIQ